MSDRRSFIKKTTLGAAGISFGATGFSAKSYGQIIGANDKVVMGIVGLRGRGKGLMKNFAGMYGEGVVIKTICDVDSQWFERSIEMVADLQNGKKPGTIGDMRKMYEDPDIDAVGIATPNHWHALATIWACQAGKHVYVEKPSSHNVWEGRKMIEAARKYNRVVQVGFQNRSKSSVMQAMTFLHSGGIGDVYMARGLCFKPRNSFGITNDSQPPENLDYNMWLGPAKWRLYNEKKGHYNWHWHWDTGNGDSGNQGPHQWDVARWGLNKKVHPVKVQSMGGIYGISPHECSQETPNTEISVVEYEDGTILEFETRGRFTNAESSESVRIGNLFYGSEGWMEVNGGTWNAYRERETEPFASSKIKEDAAVNGDQTFITAPDSKGHFGNFIEAVRSGNPRDLNCDIAVGHMSTSLVHIANIAYRVGETLRFNGEFEKFIDHNVADMMLTRNYRPPFIVPDQV